MKKIASLALGGMLFFTTSFAFTDFDNTHWAYNNVMTMHESGIISGFPDNTFKPDDSLTREQFITIATRGLKLEKPSLVRQFSDVFNRWSNEFIDIGGYSMCDLEDLEFRPAEPATREDVAMSIVKLNELEDYEYSLKTLEGFTDRESIAKNRRKYVAIAVENGLMNGNINGTFAPKKALTRAEGATVALTMLNQKNIDISNIKNIEGSYLMGKDFDPETIDKNMDLQEVLSKIPNTATLDIANVNDKTADFTMGGVLDGKIISLVGKLYRHGSKWKYLDEFNNKYTLEIEFNNNKAVIKGFEMNTYKFNGEYLKK